MRQGQLTATELLETCLDRIEHREATLKAWAYLAIDRAREQAARWDAIAAALTRQSALHRGWTQPLQGIPIGVKDIFATADMPTGWGTALYQRRILHEDAAVVARLRAAGAIVLGKTTTTEFALTAPSATVNPHNPDHTPGGSSSGSAAAVAAGMVPLAIGSQTLGSTLRPAAYCGVFGFKPSFGLISRYGMMPLCRDLDQVGVFARSLPDLGRLVAVLTERDGRDPDCVGSDLTAPGQATALPKLALILPGEPLEAIARSRLAAAAKVLQEAGSLVEVEVLPLDLEQAWEQAQILCACGLAVNHGALLEGHADRCSPQLLDWLKQGRQANPLAYAEARQRTVLYRQALQPLFDRYDAILTAVAPGPAPLGLASTGSSIFCALWTLCGLPALSLPLGVTTAGLPLGGQLVGRPHGDRRLLQVAAWCWPLLKAAFGGIPVSGA